MNEYDNPRIFRAMALMALTFLATCALAWWLR